MDPEHRFYFRGPKGELNLPAQNLRIFMQLGEGVDDETWLHHLRQGDYDRWFREIIKDEAAGRAGRTHLAQRRCSRRRKAARRCSTYIRKKYEKEA